MFNKFYITALSISLLLLTTTTHAALTWSEKFKIAAISVTAGGSFNITPMNPPVGNCSVFSFTVYQIELTPDGARANLLNLLEAASQNSDVQLYFDDVNPSCFAKYSTQHIGK